MTAHAPPDDPGRHTKGRIALAGVLAMALLAGFFFMSRGGGGDAPERAPQAIGNWEEVSAPLEVPIGPAVWTGSSVFVSSFSGIARFDPVESSWELAAEPGGPALQGAILAWTGKKLIRWGGTVGENHEPIDSGAVLDVETGTWRALPPSPLPPGHSGSFSAAWSGTELFFWGTARSGESAAAAYDPDREEWRRFDPGPLAGRGGTVSTWTGTELLVWGGSVGEPATGRAIARMDGAAYDPRTSAWRRVQAAPLDPRLAYEVAWSGSELVVWGGRSTSVDEAGGYVEAFYADGAAYSPEADTWRLIPRSPLEARYGAGSAVIGGRIFFWGGGSSQGHHLADGALFDPVRNEWTELADAGLRARTSPTTVSIDDAVLVIGGCCSAENFPLADGALWRLPDEA